MNGRGWKLDHIGHAVNAIDSHLPHLCDILGFAPAERERLEQHGVEVLFLEKDGTVLELLAPLGEASTLQRFLSKRGEALHHICFRVDDIETELRALQARGARLIDLQPRPGSRNTLVAFLHPSTSGGVMIELCQERPRTIESGLNVKS